MKRLLRIGVNLAVFSFIPILSWFALGFLVDKNLTNVFTLTYPLQFVASLLLAVFGTGANISKEKDKNDHAVLSGMTLGIVIGFFVFGFLAFHTESYIDFMKMDVAIYKEFVLYSVIQLYIQLVFQLVLEKLYFEEKEKLANRYCFTFNMLNFTILVISSLVLKEKMHIVLTTLFSIFVYVFYVTIKQYRNFKWKCKVSNFIKYNAVDIFTNFAFFIIYLFGFSNALEFGEEYLVAINFVALITDMQWDVTGAITTVAKIDISKNRFNYKEHRKNAYRLTAILLTSVLILFLTLFQVYQVDVSLALIYLGIDVYNFLIYPIYAIKTCYLQLEWSSIKTTSNKIISDTMRTFMSFLKTPFNTGIGQLLSSTHQLISINIIFKKHYKVQEDGTLLKCVGEIMKSNYGLRYELLDKDNLDIAFNIQKEIWPSDPDYMDLYDKATNTKDDNCFFLVYRKNDLIGITGVDVYQEYPNTVWLDWFAILPKYRRKGYGKQVLMDTIAYCRSLNRFDAFRIDTTYYENRPALFLYDQVMQLKEDYTAEDTETIQQQTIIYSYSLNGKLELWNNQYLGLTEYYDNCNEK